jgi:hypothetical protein
MIHLAKANVPSAQFTNKWSDVKEAKQGSTNSILVLNSVLHEVISYSDKAELSTFWEQLLKSGFTYISIRDMMPSSDVMDRTLDDEEIERLRRNVIDTYPHGEEEWDSFESEMYPIDNEGAFMHFMLKVHYWDNWDREVHENYFGLFLDDFLDIVAGSPYRIVHKQPFILPYFAEYAKREVGYDIVHPSHVKLLLESK